MEMPSVVTAQSYVEGDRDRPHCQARSASGRIAAMMSQPGENARRQAETPAEAWALLRAGNARFVRGTSERPHQDEARRRQTADGQAPFATVFGCMDSRVGAELIFDRGLGDLAVVRTAGHVLGNAVLGSLEFGHLGLGTPLIVVLGHDSCGAVNATIAAHETGDLPGGHIRDVVERLMPSLIASHLDLASLGPDELSDLHVRHTVRLLAERSPAIAQAISLGQLAVVGAAYRLAEGQVRLLDVIGDIGVDGAMSAAEI
jgi:carbonic anhydrase